MPAAHCNVASAPIEPGTDGVTLPAGRAGRISTTLSSSAPPCPRPFNPRLSVRDDDQAVSLRRLLTGSLDRAPRRNERGCRRVAYGGGGHADTSAVIVDWIVRDD